MLSRRRLLQAFTFIGVEFGLRKVLGMATITVTPNPAAPSTICTVTGANFEKKKTRLLLDGVAIALPSGTSSFQPRRDGSFSVNFITSSVPKIQTVIAQQMTGPKVNSAVWVEVARTTVGFTGIPGSAPTQPLDLAGVPSDTSVALTWSAPISSGGSTIANYRVYRGGVLVASPTDTTYTVTGLSPETQYSFTVSAVNAIGEGPQTAAVVVTTIATPTPVGNVVAFPPTGSGSQFLALLADNTIDAIELNGTYHLPYAVVNINRTTPVEVRPAPGANAILSGSQLGPDPQWSFGFGGRTANINLTDLIFDGFILGQQGVIQTLDVRSMTFQDITVRNSRSNGTTAQPYHSWAAYISANSNYHPSGIVLDGWTVTGSGRNMSGITVDGGDNVTVSNWSVSGLYLAVHVSPNSSPITALLLDTWTIADSGAASWWGVSNVSVAMESAAGTFKNMHATSSGGYINTGSPTMTDGGGNTWS